MKKRSISLILALIMCLSQLLIPVSATGTENPLHFEMAAEAVYPGDEVTVTVTLTKNPGVIGLELTPTFDKKVFELVSMTGFIDDMVCTTSKTAVFDAMENVSYTGKALEIVLKAKADAAIGNYTVGLDVFAGNANEDEIEASVAAATVNVTPRPVTGISLDQTTLSLDQGGTATLTATVEPADAGDKTVTWTSSNESVATVADGVVTAVGAGSATITAKAGEFEATCAVTVAGANVPVTGITLDRSAFQVFNSETYVMEGNSATLIATVTPDYATDKTVTWTSSDEAIATVADGVVTALTPGSVTITAAAGEVSATCVITVFDNPFTMTADGETVALQYTGSGTSRPSSLCYYTVEVPTGTKIVKLTGPMTTDWSMSQTLKDNLADGAITLDLSTLSRSGDHWEISMVAKNGYYWGANHVISIYMESCEGDHTFTDATCTAPKTCTVCYTTEGEALGHNLVETTAQVDAICETPGTTAVMSCTRCDYTEGGTAIPAPGHAWRKVMDTKQPTCDEEGETLYTCTTCPEGNAATKTEPIAALGHTWNEGEVTTQPTCTEKGVKTFHCTVCEDGTKTEEVPANGHNYVDGYCSVCNKMEPTEIPFTDANHTSNGNAFNQYLAGVDCLVVDGIAISDWTEWTGSMNKSITIYVDPVYKNAPVTISLKAKDGYTGTLGLFASPVTVNLSEGVGEYLARSNKIGIANFGCFVYFKLGECTGKHTWEEATCTEPKTCSVCGKTEGEALGHSMDAATSTCTICGISNTITKIEVSHPNLNTTAKTLTMTTGTTEQITATTNAVDESVASTQMVAWFSSDETVATVDQNGKITALAAGTTTITAKAVDASGIALLADGEEVLAQFTLTVADPAPGYTVTMGADVENALIGSTVSVPVTVGHTGEVTKYNAFDFTFTYDPAILELTSTEISGMTVTAENGQIHVERYGTDLTVGAPALTLTFNAIATGNSNVKVTSAKVDIAEAALTQDAPDASVIDDLTQVSVSGYTVTLPEEFKGESSVLPGEDYTFTAKDKNYNYTVTAKIGDTEVTVTDNGDGTFKIAAKDITGNLVITTEKSAKEFTVTLGEDMTGETKATYMTDYTATLTKDAAYNYNVEVTIGNVKYTGFSYDLNTGLITIHGEAITGAIAFNTNKTAKTQDQHSVTIGGNSGDVTGATEVTNGEDYTFTIAKEVGYTYAVSATMNGEAVEVIDNGNGTYTIKGVTGDLEITVTKTYDMEVEVNQYVGLDGKVMFLVTAKASVDTGKALAYAENAMYYSEVYGAWSWLVITDGTLTVEDAKAQITLVEAETVTLTATKDVNESTKVDINDAQLVFDMYNNEYQTFETATMQKFLKADVTGDKAINVNDAAAIVADIIAAK